MNKQFFKMIFFALCLLLFIGVIHISVSADDAETLYRDECGACHLVYPPELLPETSWRKIMEGLHDHFGEEIILLEGPERLILIWLESRSAENSSEDHAIKIMGSLGRNSPIRITDIPYIRKEHKDISADIFDRESVGTFSNCAACHLDAESSIFNKEDVAIPE